MKIQSSATAVALVVLLSARAEALDPTRPLSDYTLTTWTDRDGLPSTTVQDLAQTPDGYLWVATLEGLIRFDGARFVTFDRANTPAIPRNDIQTLIPTPEGGLWIASYGGGLVQYRNGGFDPRGGGPATIGAMGVSKRGVLYVGTGEGLFRLEGDAYEAVRPDRASFPVSISALAVDPEGLVYVGTANGVFLLEDGHLRRLPLDLPEGGAGVTSLALEANGTLWVGTSRGLYTWSEGSSQLVVRMTAPVKAILPDHQGGVWLGAGKRLGRLRHGRLEWLATADGLGAGLVMALLQDREGSLWVGTTGGLTQVKDGPVVSHGVREGLRDPEVLTVARLGDGGILTGTARGDLDRLEGRRFTPIEPAPSLGNGRVLALLEDGSRLWIGTDDGLVVRDGGSWRHAIDGYSLPRESVRSLLRDRRGALWIGTDGGGLYAMQGGRLHHWTKTEGLPSNQVRGLLEARDGTLWVATYGGLVAVRGDAPTSLTLLRGLSSDTVRSLHEDVEGVLWVGTYGGGLNRVEAGKVTAITSKEGLLSDVIYQILDDGERLWMSCNRGIFAVARSDLRAFALGEVARVRSEVYGREDGLPSEECSGGFPAGFRDPEGRLWFATAAGLVSVDPARSLRRRAAAPVIEEVLVDGRERARVPVVEVPRAAQRLEVRYTSIGFSGAERLTFAHRLEGLDDAWVEADRRRFALYTNLPPGRYTFRVRARADGGEWREGAPLEVVVAARWYETRVFLAALALSLPLGLVVGYKLRVRGLLARERELKHRVEQAVARVKVLRGLLPICAGCKKIRGSEGYWRQIEAYIRDHSEAEFSHGLCPECTGQWFPGYGAPGRPSG